MALTQHQQGYNTAVEAASMLRHITPEWLKQAKESTDLRLEAAWNLTDWKSSLDFGDGILEAIDDMLRVE
jgi:hypothetical protein